MSKISINIKVIYVKNNNKQSKVKQLSYIN